MITITVPILRFWRRWVLSMIIVLEDTVKMNGVKKQPTWSEKEFIARMQPFTFSRVLRRRTLSWSPVRFLLFRVWLLQIQDILTVTRQLPWKIQTTRFRQFQIQTEKSPPHRLTHAPVLIMRKTNRNIIQNLRWFICLFLPNRALCIHWKS